MIKIFNKLLILVCCIPIRAIAVVQNRTSEVFGISANCDVVHSNPKSNSVEIKLPEDGMYKYLGLDIEKHKEIGSYEIAEKFIPEQNMVRVTINAWAHNQCFCAGKCSGPRSTLEIRAIAKFDDEGCNFDQEPMIEGLSVSEAKKALELYKSSLLCRERVNEKRKKKTYF